MNSEKETMLLILVPHRDTRKILQNYSREIFNLNFYEANFFPNVAPLAVLSQPLNKTEFKNINRNIRNVIGKDKITTKELKIIKLKDEISLLGLGINISFSKKLFNCAEKKIMQYFDHIVIGAFLFHKKIENINLPPVPEISFRSAAIANMFLRPMEINAEENAALGFEWEIGELFWLPKK